MLSQAAEREKDRASERYRLDADGKIAQARQGAENARAEAAQARAEAEKAKLETAQIGERLLRTQGRLDAANHVSMFTEAQISKVVNSFLGFNLEGTQLVWASANDRQAQRRLQQLAIALAQADQRLKPTPVAGSIVPPVGEEGEILVHYWSEDRRTIAHRIASIFEAAGLETNVYQLPQEPDETAREATRNMVLIGVGARVVGAFQDR